MEAQVRAWLHGLIATVVSSAANAALLVVMAPELFTWGNLTLVARVAFAGGLVSALAYLKQSPLPPSKSQ